ncbi:MAG: DUF2157 domain-containing protein [Flavobacteriaceae bacterium]|nr:DUF2157 domain-containing protein [Flavobacteriaceae bacterium]
MSLKIKRELTELVEAKVISSEVSLDISSYYASKLNNSPNKLFAIFGVLGSLLVGLGVILILAHNWDDFSRTTKTIWTFIPLVVGQLFVAYTLFKKKSAAWKETAATFLFFAIGACISLVSQIYHISGSMESFLLTWIVLAAPMVYLLRSHAVVLLYLIFSTVYACGLGYFNESSPWWFLLLIAYVIPFYYQQLKTASTDNLTGIFNWLFPLSLFISLGAFITGNGAIGFFIYVTLFGLYYNIGKLPFFVNQRLRSNGYLLLGSLGMVITLMVATFEWVWNENRVFYESNTDLAIAIFLVLATIGVMLYLFQKRTVPYFNLFQFAFICFAIILGTQNLHPELPTILTNLLVFALGIFAVWIGSRQERFSILNYGLLIITVLITCRFFDTNISFIIRGLLFVAIGVGFFGANYLMHKKQQKQNTVDNE